MSLTKKLAIIGVSLYVSQFLVRVWWYGTMSSTIERFPDVPHDIAVKAYNSMHRKIVTGAIVTDADNDTEEGLAELDRLFMIEVDLIANK